MRISQLYTRTKAIDPNPSSLSGRARLWTGDSRVGDSDSTRVARSSKRWASAIRFGTDGYSTLGGCLLLFTFIAGFGLLSAIRHVRAISERQVNLDRCTGAATLFLRAAVISLEHSYARLEAARLITLPLILTPSGPAALEAFKTAARAEKIFQEAIQLSWKTEQTRWTLMTGLGCRLRGHPVRSAFPQFDFPIVDPESALIDLKSTRFQLQKKPTFRLWIRYAKLSSGTVLTKGVAHEWETYWEI